MLNIIPPSLWTSSYVRLIKLDPFLWTDCTGCGSGCEEHGRWRKAAVTGAWGVICEEAYAVLGMDLFSPSHLFGFPACANGSGINESLIVYALWRFVATVGEGTLLATLWCTGNMRGFLCDDSTLLESDKLIRWKGNSGCSQVILIKLSAYPCCEGK